jgi:hypothetical protein
VAALITMKSKTFSSILTLRRSANDTPCQKQVLTSAHNREEK